MKKTSIPKSRVKRSAGKAPEGELDDMRTEYRFDYANARPNRFAATLSTDRVAVVLDPDVAAVFRSSEAVNDFLRSVIQAMPESSRNHSG